MLRQRLELLVQEENRLVTIGDARDSYGGGCVPGWKEFCINANLDWKTITRHGMKASELLAIDDAMVLDLLAFKYKDKLGE
jgi:hypothetical protein